MDITIDEGAVQDEARKTFDMRARLMGATRRTKTVTVYTDDTAGAELGSVVDEMLGEYATGRKIRTGLIGKLDEITERAKSSVLLLDEDADDYDERVAEINAMIGEESDAITAEITALQEKMHESSMTFTIQALPDVIVRSITRKAKAALEIKGKGIPEALEEEYALEYTAHFLSASTVQFTDNASGETFRELSVEDAKALRDFLPAGQFPRLDRAMVELSIEAQISNQATDTPDF